MKALIIKKGNKRGRYYHGRTIKEIVKKFMQSKPNLKLITMLEAYRIGHIGYDIYTRDIKTGNWVIYVIPKTKIIK